MKWKEIFTGGKAVRDARKMAKELKKKRALSKSERNKLRKAFKFWKVGELLLEKH